MKQEKSPYLYLILTILLWSATPAVAKLALRELNNYQLLLYTSIVGVFSLFIVNLFQGKLSLLSTYTKSDYLKLFGMGFLGIFLYYIFLYGSFALAPAGQVNVMNYLWPVFIILFSIPILKEKANYKTLLAVSVSFLGALIAFTKGNFSVFSNAHAVGYLLAALGAVCYGLFSVLGKKLEYDKFSSMLVYYISAALLIIPTALSVSDFVIPRFLTTIISILVLGGIMNSIAFVFWFKALKLGHTHQTANLIYSVPFLAMIWTYFLNAEPFAISSVIGLLLIVTGIFIQLKNKT
ncbi:MAG TPA: DMT family transporter [Candidatus Nanoarchaeia archaeon]|nr:DMT family transporter [Candidatus Nanoarchaeia archaeon]